MNRSMKTERNTIAVIGVPSLNPGEISRYKPEEA
jgi:hypothetical protein